MNKITIPRRVYPLYLGYIDIHNFPPETKFTEWQTWVKLHDRIQLLQSIQQADDRSGSYHYNTGNSEGWEINQDIKMVYVGDHPYYLSKFGKDETDDFWRTHYSKTELFFRDLASVDRDSRNELKNCSKCISEIAKKTNSSFEDAKLAAEEFSKQGLSSEQVAKSTEAALAIAKLSGASIKDSVEGIASVISTFGNKAGDYAGIVEKLLFLDAKFAISAGGIIQGLTRVAEAAKQAGLSLEETASALTALKQVTGRDEAVLGNSLKSILASLQSEKVIKDLRSISIEVKDLNGEFRDLTHVIRDLSVAFEGLDEDQKLSITQKVAGKYQSNAFTGLLKSFNRDGEFDKALAISGVSNASEKLRDSLGEVTECLKKLDREIIKMEKGI